MNQFKHSGKSLVFICGMVCFSSGHADITTYLAPGWQASEILTLTSASRALEFDSEHNLYIESTTDNGSGTIKILKLDALSGYTTSSEFATYSTGYFGATSLSFDGLGNLYVAERSESGDQGVIRKLDVATRALIGDVRTFSNQRPTGIDAVDADNLFYSARRESDPSFGNIYRIDSNGLRTTLIADVVGTGIAVDNTGKLFISTPHSSFGGLIANSIYSFDLANTSQPTLVASFSDAIGVEELVFDGMGNLYLLDNTTNTHIIQLSSVPIPSAIWLFGSTLLGLLSLSGWKKSA